MIRFNSCHKFLLIIVLSAFFFQGFGIAQTSNDPLDTAIKGINPVTKTVYLSRQYGGSFQTVDYRDGLFFIGRGAVLSIYDQVPAAGVEAKKLVLLDKQIETVTVSKRWIIVTCTTMEAGKGTTTIIANDPVNDFPILKKIQHDFIPSSAIAVDSSILIGGNSEQGIIEFYTIKDEKNFALLRRESIPYNVQNLDVINSMLVVGTGGTSFLYSFNPESPLQLLYQGVYPSSGGIMRFQDAVYFAWDAGISMMALTSGIRPEAFRNYDTENILYKTICTPEGIYLGELASYTGKDNKGLVLINRINHSLDPGSHEELIKLPASEIRDMAFFPQGLLVALGDEGLAVIHKKEDGTFTEPTIENNPVGTMGYASWRDNSIVYNDIATARVIETSYEENLKKIDSRIIGFSNLPYADVVLNASETEWIEIDNRYDYALQKYYFDSVAHGLNGDKIAQASFELPANYIISRYSNYKTLGTRKNEIIFSLDKSPEQDLFLGAVTFGDSVFNPLICCGTTSSNQTIIDTAFIDANTFLLLKNHYSYINGKNTKGIGIYTIDPAHQSISEKQLFPLPINLPNFSPYQVITDGKRIVVWEISKNQELQKNIFHIYSLSADFQETYLGSYESDDVFRRISLIQNSLWLCGPTNLYRCDLEDNLEQWNRFSFPSLATPLPFRTEQGKFWISSIFTGFIELSENPPSIVPIVSKPDPDTENTIPVWQRLQRIAGLGVLSVTEDAHPLNTILQSPDRMIRAKDGRLFVAESRLNQILEIIPDKSVRIIYSEPFDPAIVFEYPMGLALNQDESKLYISDSYSHKVKALNLSTGAVEEIAGSGLTPYNGDNLPANQTNLDAPTGIAITDDNRIIIAEARGQRIRMILQDGTAHVLAGAHGAENPGRDWKTEKGAVLNSFIDLGLPADLSCFHNTIFFSSFDKGCVFKMDLSDANLPTPHNLTVIAGGIFGFGDEYPELDLSNYLSYPEGIAVSEDNRLLVCDTVNRRILETDLDGNLITTFGGNGPGNYGDLMPYCYMKAEASDVCFAQDGTIYFCDPNNNVIRAITGKPVFAKDIKNPLDTAVMEWSLF